MKIIKVRSGKPELTEIHEERKYKLKEVLCYHCWKQTDTMFYFDGMGDGFSDEYLCSNCIKKFALLLVLNDLFFRVRDGDRKDGE